MGRSKNFNTEVVEVSPVRSLELRVQQQGLKAVMYGWLRTKLAYIGWLENLLLTLVAGGTHHLLQFYFTGNR